MTSTVCGFCERFSNFTYRWGRQLANGAEVRIAATCDFCGNLSVARGTPAKVVTQKDTTEGAYVSPAADSAPDLEWWPKVGYAPSVVDVPAHISRAAREAYSSASVGNNMAAILMARTVVEATAKANGISSGNLATKINSLRDKQLIRPSIAEQAHEVRFAGNDMAHGDIDVAPDATDAEEVLALMAEVLTEVFQGPARMARIRAKRGATGD